MLEGEEIPREAVTYFGKKLGEYRTTCPVCGRGEFLITEIAYEVPALGPVLIVSKRCTTCGYRRNDMVPLRSSRRTRIYLRVECPEDYRAKVFRSPFARVIVPELGLDLKPSMAAEMFVTNVEGVLRMFLDAVEKYEVLEGVSLESLKERLTRVIENQASTLTVVIDDDEGVSVCIPEPGSKPIIVIETV
uniref:ZPR1 zinc finger domain-containing protein n=1 Tax=Thermofilum pendens TaxID=2269 RepID=A0A7C1NYC0_THEPE